MAESISVALTATEVRSCGVIGRCGFGRGRHHRSPIIAAIDGTNGLICIRAPTQEVVATVGNIMVIGQIRRCAAVIRKAISIRPADGRRCGGDYFACWGLGPR